MAPDERRYDVDGRDDTAGFRRTVVSRAGGVAGFRRIAAPRSGGVAGFRRIAAPRSGGVAGFRRTVVSRAGGVAGFRRTVVSRAGGVAGFRRIAAPRAGGVAGFTRIDLLRAGGVAGFLETRVGSLAAPRLEPRMDEGRLVFDRVAEGLLKLLEAGDRDGALSDRELLDEAEDEFLLNPLADEPPLPLKRLAIAVAELKVAIIKMYIRCFAFMLNSFFRLIFCSFIYNLPPFVSIVHPVAVNIQPKKREI